MSIASRITSITGHITDIYDTLELGGDTTQNKNIVNINAEIKREYKDFLAHGTDTLWNNWEKVNATNVETTSLSPTIKGKMEISLKGNTQQNGEPTPDTPVDIQVVSGDNTIKVEGKNLFDKEAITENKYLDINGVEQNDNTKCYSDYIAINSNNNYITNQMGNWGGVCTCYYDTNKTFISAETGSTIVGNNNIFTIPSNAYYMRVSTNKSWLDITQIELGNQATTYQAYKGASYPISLGSIELCKIGTYQDKIAKSTGKNLFDKDITPENYYYDANGEKVYQSGINYINQEINNINYNSITISFISKIGDANVRVCEYNSSGTFITRTLVNTNNQVVNLNNSTAKIILSVNSDNSSNFTNLMINKGTTALPYEPYGTDWYLNKQIGKVVLDGSEFWDKIDNSTPDYIYVVSTAIDNIAGYGTFLEYSNYFSQPTRKITPSYVTDKPVISGTDSNEDVRIRILVPTSTADSLNNFKIWLSTHNTTVYYVLATQTYEEITDTTLLGQLNALENANSYNNTTNVSQVNDDMPFILDLTALKEMA